MSFALYCRKLTLLVVLLFLEVYSIEHCRIVQCATKLSFQHATEISQIQYFSVTENSCKAKLSRLNLDDLSMTFCQDQFFCGLDLSPQLAGKTGLGFNQTDSCFLFTASEQRCESVVDQLRKNGYFFRIDI